MPGKTDDRNSNLGDGHSVQFLLGFKEVCLQVFQWPLIRPVLTRLWEHFMWERCANCSMQRSCTSLRHACKDLQIWCTRALLCAWQHRAQIT